MGSIFTAAIAAKEKKFKMKLAALFCVLVVFAVGCCAEKDEDKNDNPDVLPVRCYFCNCPRELDQVCGSDGRTYQNICMMKCAKERCPKLTENLDLGKKPLDGPCEQED